MNKLEFWLVAGSFGGKGFFHRVQHLPIEPTPGLAIALAPDEDSWEIEQVTRPPGGSQYLCVLREHIDPQADWERMKRDFIERGWRLVKEWPAPHEPHAPLALGPRWLAGCRGEG
jgi:hypothetical protein